MARDMEDRIFAEPEIVDSPINFGDYNPQILQNQFAVGQQGIPDYNNFNFGNFDLSAFSQPQYSEPVYSQPTAQPTQAVPYYEEPLVQEFVPPNRTYGYDPVEPASTYPPTNYGFDPYNIGDIGLSSYAAPSYQSQPTPQPVQTAPYYGDYSYDPYNIGNFGLSSYQQSGPTAAQLAARDLELTKPGVASAQWDPQFNEFMYTRTPMKVAEPTGPYYVDPGEFDPVYSSNNTSGFLPGAVSADFSGTLNKTLAKASEQGLTQADQQPTAASAVGMPAMSSTSGFLPGTTTADFSGFLNKVLTQADQQGLTQANQMGALPATQPGATSAAISANAPPPGTTWGVYSDPNDTTSQYTVNFMSNKKGAMPLTVSADTPVFLYDNKTKQVLASGVGKEGADAVAAAVYRLNNDPKGSSYWDIYTGPPGATDSSQFRAVVSDAQDKNFGQRFLSAVGTLLPIAVQFIPGLGQASLLTKIGAGAAAGAGGAALKGQDILKGALIGGATSGVMGAKVLPGHQNLSGVVGGALGKVPVVGDALKTVSGALTKGTSTWNPVEGGVVTATKSAAPALLSGGLSSLASSQLNNALNLAQKYPGTTNYADRVYDKNAPVEETTLEQQFDDTFSAPTTVYGRRLSELAPAASGAAQTLVPKFEAPEYVDDRTIEVKKRNEPLNLEAPVSAATQFLAPENVDPNEIVVKNKYQPRTLDEIAAGTVSSLLPSLLNNAAAPSTTPQKKDSTKSTIGKIVGGLTIADALAKIISKLAGGGGGSGGTSPGGQQLQSVFSAKLPRASGIFAPENLAPRDMSGTDWLRYGYGPEAAFFRNVPTSDAERTALVNAYRPSQLALSGTGSAASSVSDPAALLNQLSSELAAAGISEADFNAYLQTPEGQQALLAMLGGTGFAKGGSTPMRHAKRVPSESFAVQGPGTGRSDEIPAVLSDGEYVIDAETVALLGDGSSKAGAKKLDEFRVNVRKHKGRNLAKGKFSVNAKRPEKYLSGGRT